MRPTETDRFKANTLVIKSRHGTNRKNLDRIGFYVNVNLPRECLEDGTLDEKLDFIRGVMEEEFGEEIPPRKVRYYITAAFLLTKANGEEKCWTGNFQPKGNHDNTLRDVADYDPMTFNQEVRTATRDHYVRTALTRVGDDTEWQFFRLASVILNFQVICRGDHGYSNRLLDSNARARLRRRRAVLHTRYFD